MDLSSLQKGRLRRELTVAFNRSRTVVPFSRRTSQTSECRRRTRDSSHELKQWEFHSSRGERKIHHGSSPGPDCLRGPGLSFHEDFQNLAKQHPKQAFLTSSLAFLTLSPALSRSLEHRPPKVSSKLNYSVILKKPHCLISLLASKLDQFKACKAKCCKHRDSCNN